MWTGRQCPRHHQWLGQAVHRCVPPTLCCDGVKLLRWLWDNCVTRGSSVVPCVCCVLCRGEEALKKLPVRSSELPEHHYVLTARTCTGGTAPSTCRFPPRCHSPFASPPLPRFLSSITLIVILLPTPLSSRHSRLPVILHPSYVTRIRWGLTSLTIPVSKYKHGFNPCTRLETCQLSSFRTMATKTRGNSTHTWLRTHRSHTDRGTQTSHPHTHKTHSKRGSTVSKHPHRLKNTLEALHTHNVVASGHTATLTYIR